MSNLNILYVVYWGAAEPLGQSLVVPAVKRLAALGAGITLVTFDKPEHLAHSAELARIRRELDAAGIRWIPLRYHKRPQSLAKLYDVAHACARGIATQIHGRATIVHARTFVGGLMGLVLAPLLRAKLVYHNEGFYPDEQVDGGVWALGGRTHRVARTLEQRCYDTADGIIALSHRARTVIEDLPAVRAKRTPVIVVPSAVDLDLFQRRTRSRTRPGGIRLIYIGSVGRRYLFDRIARFAGVARQVFGDIRLRVLSHSDHDLIRGLLVTSGLPRDAWSIDHVPHARVPDELVRQDAGLFFLTEGISEHGCSPTKIGEYWACGLPVVTTPNVSDTDAIVQRERVGVIVREHSDAGYEKAAHELKDLLGDPELGARCRRAAETHYALAPACERQIALYREILS